MPFPLLVIIATIIYQAYYYYLVDTIRYAVYACGVANWSYVVGGSTVNQEAWNRVSDAMETLRTVFTDETVSRPLKEAARSAWTDCFRARNALLEEADKALGLVGSDATKE